MAGNMLVMNRHEYGESAHGNGDWSYGEGDEEYPEMFFWDYPQEYYMCSLFDEGDGIGNGGLSLFDNGADNDNVEGCASLIHGWDGFWSRTIC